MHIGVAGPASLSMLDGLDEQQLQMLGEGYPFPLITQYVNALLRRGHSVSLFTTGSDVRRPETAEAGPLTVDVIPQRRARARTLDLFAAERAALVAAIRDRGPDVIHAHWTYEFAWAALGTSLPCVITAHDWAPTVLRFQPSIYRTARLVMQMRTLARARALITAPSPYLASRIERVYRRRVAVIPNAVRLPDAEPPFPVRDAEGSSEVLVGTMVNGFGSRKNTKGLLEAFAIALRENSKLRLRIAGADHEPGGPADSWARRHGLARHVIFLGPVEGSRIEQFWAGLSIFCLASREETFGMVLIEAMARGLPVIGGKASGAVPWVLGDAGVLVDVSRPQSIASALSLLAGDSRLRAQHRTRGLARIRDFDLDVILGNYLQLYEEARLLRTK